MDNIKTIMEKCVKYGGYKTLGQLCGAYAIEEAIPEIRTPGDDTSQKIYEELKRLIPIWEKEFGFDMQTELKEIIKKI